MKPRIFTVLVTVATLAIPAWAAEGRLCNHGCRSTNWPKSAR